MAYSEFIRHFAYYQLFPWGDLKSSRKQQCNLGGMFEGMKSLALSKQSGGK